MSQSGPILRLRLGPDESELDFVGEDGFEGHARLRVGYQRLVDSCLRHSPPEPLELERAIDVTENALTEVPSLPRGAILMVDDGQVRRLLARIVRADEAAVLRVGTDDVESAFQRMAAVSLGYPADVQSPGSTPREAAMLVILRELMHHLGFETVIA